MRLRIVHVLVIGTTVLVGACRQGDGVLPIKANDVPQRLVDLSRDLENMAGGDPQAVQELGDDIAVFTEKPDGIAAAHALATTLAPMLVKRTLSQDVATRMATLLWTAAAAQEMSERQMDAIKDDLRGQLLSVGVSQQDANLAAGRVGDVQKAVTRRNRRWYERY